MPLREHLRNEVVRRTEVYITEVIQKSKLRRFGYLVRRDEEEPINP